LREVVQEIQSSERGPIPFTGLVGYFGYDLFRMGSACKNRHTDSLQLSVASRRFEPWCFRTTRDSRCSRWPTRSRASGRGGCRASHWPGVAVVPRNPARRRCRPGTPSAGGDARSPAQSRRRPASARAGGEGRRIHRRGVLLPGGASHAAGRARRIETLAPIPPRCAWSTRAPTMVLVRGIPKCRWWAPRQSCWCATGRHIETRHRRHPPPRAWTPRATAAAATCWPVAPTSWNSHRPDFVGFPVRLQRPPT